MPLEGHRLVIEPNYPKAMQFMAIGEDVDDEPTDRRVRNVFYSTRLRCDVVVMEQDGRVSFGIRPAIHHLTHDLETLGASDAWGIEQESAALRTLATLIRPRAFKQYLLSGMFLESSRRSKITYLFRRLKPTAVLRARGNAMCVMCTLCLHPIGYYAGSWAGAMCPTDDVIAHLMLMRGDEPMLWRRANQHAPHRPEAGL